MFYGNPRINNGAGLYENGGGGGGGTNPPLPGTYGRIYETDFSNFNIDTMVDTPRMGDPVNYATSGGRLEEINGEKFFIVENNGLAPIYGPNIDISNALKYSFGMRIYTDIGAADGANVIIMNQNQQIIIIDPYFYSPPKDFGIWGALTPRTVFLSGVVAPDYSNYYQIPNKDSLYNGGIFDVRIDIDKTAVTDNYLVYINNQLFMVGSGDFSSFSYVTFRANSGRNHNVIGFTNCFVDVIE